jgi:hypothetical protein
MKSRRYKPRTYYGLSREALGSKDYQRCRNMAIKALGLCVRCLKESDRTDKVMCQACSLSESEHRKTRKRNAKPRPEKFWEHVNKNTKSGCWEWVGPRFETGYGQCVAHPETTHAHRTSWLLNRGEIPHGLCVCHKCDNPPCVNPDHLFLGTRSDNAIDMASKDRAHRPFGDKAPSAKLTWEKVFEMRSLSRAGVSDREIARRYGVSRSNVRMIRLCITWKESDYLKLQKQHDHQ